MAILVYFGGSAGNTEKYTTFHMVVLVTVSTTVQFLMMVQWGPKHVGVYRGADKSFVQFLMMVQWGPKHVGVYSGADKSLARPDWSNN